MAAVTLLIKKTPGQSFQTQLQGLAGEFTECAIKEMILITGKRGGRGVGGGSA